MRTSQGRRFPKYPESTISLLLDPYGFISKTCRRLGTDLFFTRVQLEKTICMTGEQAAELFYDPDKFERRGAAPGRIQKTLFGKGGVQGLDDQEHRHRKAMFMSLVTPQRVQELAQTSGHCWEVYATRWSTMPRVVLYSELHELLCRSVCQWAGVPLPEKDVGTRSRQLMSLFQYAGSIGPGNWWARFNRKLANRWIEDVIKSIRLDAYHAPPSSAAYIIATHRGLDNRLLSLHDAAVELLNVLRPVVAVSVYIAFAATAVHQYPTCREKLRHRDERYLEWFVEEVRRYYPFFPLLVARVRRDFRWHGYEFPRGTQTFLDLYGTNHDPRTWDDPDSFRPERFHHSAVSDFNFIPQGGGDADTGHRCPGESIAKELIKVAAEFLVHRLRYDVPDQNLTVYKSRLPALPVSGFVIENVELTQ